MTRYTAADSNILNHKVINSKRQCLCIHGNILKLRFDCKSIVLCLNVKFDRKSSGDMSKGSLKFRAAQHVHHGIINTVK